MIVEVECFTQYTHWDRLITVLSYTLDTVYTGEYPTTSAPFIFPLQSLLFKPSLIYVISIGVDYSKCGCTLFPCKTVRGGFTKAPLSAGTEIHISLVGISHPMEDGETPFTGEGSVLISPSDTTVTPVKTLTSVSDVSVIFSITGMPVGFSQLSFAGDSSATLGCTLFSVSSTGSLTLTSISMTPSSSGVISTTAPLITMNSAVNGGNASLSITGCIFDHISLTSANGAVLSATLSSTDTLSVSTTAFTSCSALKGGAIFLRPIELPNISFEEIDYINQSNQALSGEQFGPTLYVETESTDYLQAGQYLPFISWDDDVDKQAMATIGSADPAILSRLFVTADPESSLFVSPSGVDGSDCGTLDDPCQTILYALTCPRYTTLSESLTPTLRLIDSIHQEDTTTIKVGTLTRAISAYVNAMYPVISSAGFTSPVIPFFSVSTGTLSLRTLTISILTTFTTPIWCLLHHIIWILPFHFYQVRFIAFLHHSISTLLYRIWHTHTQQFILHFLHINSLTSLSHQFLFCDRCFLHLHHPLEWKRCCV